MQIFVLGMHRSGTSAAARVLNLMGCYFGAEDIGTAANEENRKGFWERKDVRQVNDAILRNMGADWDRIASLDMRSIGKGDEAVYRQVIQEIVVNMDAHRPWFVKEPRFCLTFGVWRPVLEMPVCVLIFRNPLDVAKSLNRRNGMPLTVGLALWEAYNARALEASQGINRIVLSYEALMSNSSVAVGKLLDALGQEGYVLRRPAKRELLAFLDDELRHHRTGDADVRGAVSEAQVALFDQLREAERSGDAGTLPSLDGASIETLAQYETTLASVSLRAKDANASLLRRQRVGVTTELALRRLELDGALQSLQGTSLELRKWRNEHDSVKARNVSLLAEASARKREISSLSKELKETSLESRKWRNEHDSVKARNVSLLAEASARKREISSLSKELKETSLESRKWRNEHDGVKARSVSLLAEGSAMKREISSLASELVQQRRTHERTVRETGGFEETLRRKDRDLVAAKESLEAAKKQAETAREVGEGLQATLKLKDRDLVAAKESLEAAKKQAETAREVGEGLQATLKLKDRDLVAAKESLEAAKKQAETAREMGEGLQATLKLKDRDLVAAKGSLEAAKKQAETAREVGEGLQATLKLKDRDLVAAKGSLEAAKKQAETAREMGEGLQATLKLKDRDLVAAKGSLEAAKKQAETAREVGEGLQATLKLKDRDLVAAKGSLEAAKKQAETAREVGEGLQATLKLKDRDLVAAKGSLEAAKKQAETAREVGEGLQATLKLKDRDLRLVAEEIDKLSLERGRLESAARRNATRIAELESLVDATLEDVELLLGSRRWRLGDGLLSAPHRLLGRRRPLTVADHLRQLQRVPRKTGSPRAVSPAGELSPPSKGSLPPTAKVMPRQRKQVTVLVLAWDVGHNPLGRAYLLAEALARSYTVVLAGFQFPRYGEAVWKPLRDSAFRTVSIQGRSFPEFQRTLERLARRIDADVVVACKARLPAVQAGLMLKALRNRPLLVDVDDYELSFFPNRQPLHDLSTQAADALAEPFEEAWTRYTENLLPFADRLLVSNPELQRRFGGVVVPHARDETVFRPELVDREAARRALGLDADNKVVMFVGTPRPHKGVLEILDAVKALQREDYCFVIVGTPPDKGFADVLRDRGENTLRLIGDQPFDQLPEVTAAADLICLLQDPETEIAQYQLPAKVVDAIAMGVPVLATDVPPLRKLIESGVIESVTKETLSPRIAWWLEATSEVRDAHRARARGAFLRDFSYDTIHRTLFNEVEKCLAAPTSLPAAAGDFLTAQARRYPSSDAKPDEGLDMVMFWKQGDIGLYGRRFDMLVRELSRRKEVRRIAVFDAPFSVYQVLRDHVPDTTVHHQVVAENKIVRRWGLLDEGKVTHHVFLFDNRALLSEDRYPHGSRFVDFVAAELDGVGIDPDEAVFWYYPVLDEIDGLSARFKPRLKVVDVVDDQRTRPDLSEEDRAEMTRHYRKVVEDADVVLANCEAVRAAMSVYGHDVALVPNGCDTDPLPPNPESRLFSRFCDLPRPILGLVGNLEGKTDLVLLERLARERPDYQLVLIGSTHANADILALDEHPNVHFFGIVPYSEVKAWIKHFDVALLPHLDTAQTRSMHPLKMLVYAAVGVRMVSTRIENLGEFEPFIGLAEGHGAFIDAVDAAVAGTAEGGGSGELADVVARNSWERRVDEIMERIDASLVT